MAASEDSMMELEELENPGNLADSLMAEMGLTPEEPVEEEHPASAALSAQLEVGLTPEQIVGAAALVRAIADGKPIVMQMGTERSGKQVIIFKDGQWVGNDANKSNPEEPPDKK